MADVVKTYKWPDGDTLRVTGADILTDGSVRFWIHTLSGDVHGTTISAGQLRALEHDATDVEQRGQHGSSTPPIT